MKKQAADRQQIEMKKGLFFDTLDNSRCRILTGVSKRTVRKLAGRFSKACSVINDCSSGNSELPLLDQMVVFCAWLRHGHDEIENLDMGYLSAMSKQEIKRFGHCCWMSPCYGEFGKNYGFSPKQLGTKKPSCLRRLFPKASCFIACIPLYFHPFLPEEVQYFVIVAFALDGRVIYVSDKCYDARLDIDFLRNLRSGMQVLSLTYLPEPIVQNLAARGVDFKVVDPAYSRIESLIRQPKLIAAYKYIRPLVARLTKFKILINHFDRMRREHVHIFAYCAGLINIALKGSKSGP